MLRGTLRPIHSTGIAAFVALLTAAAPHAASGQTVELASLERPARSHTPPEPLVRETCEFYDVRGRSDAELRAGIRRNVPRMPDGNSYDAFTRWDVRWEYGHDRSSGACSVNAFQAIVDISYRFPRWVYDDDAPPALLSDWETYLENLVRHEQGHRDIALAAAAELSRAASELPARAACADLDRDVLALGRSVMKQLSLDEKEYDTDTAHGVLQGAVLP